MVKFGPGLIPTLLAENLRIHHNLQFLQGDVFVFDEVILASGTPCMRTSEPVALFTPVKADLLSAVDGPADVDAGHPKANLAVFAAINELAHVLKLTARLSHLTCRMQTKRRPSVHSTGFVR